VTFSYDEKTMVFQNVATEIINVNPFNVANFIGNIKLSPSSDIWYDTKSQPNINIVNEDQAAWQAAVGGTGHGSQWNDWQLNWTGENPVVSSDQASVARDTQAITNAIASQGLSAAVSGGNIQVSSTTKVLSNAIVPYARTIPVNFELFGMVPYTYLHTFMDGICVDQYVTPNGASTDGLYFINITNAGSGYTDGNNQSIITVIGNHTLEAVVTANVYGGQIVAVDIIKTGKGYTSLPTLQVTGANTSTAILTPVSAGYAGARLFTDENGYASGVINIPNDDFVKLPSGVITVEFADNFFTPIVGSSYAKTTFLAQGTLQTTQTTVVSTRPPKVTPKPQVVSRGSSPAPYNPPLNPTVVSTSTGTSGGGGPDPQPAPTIYFRDDSLNPGSHNYAVGSDDSYKYIQNYAEAAFSVATGQTNVQFDPNVVKEQFNQVVSTIDANQKEPVSGTEALAASLYITNEVAAGVSLADAQDSLAQICATATVSLDQLATSYLEANAVQDTAGHEANAGCVDGTDPLSQNFFVNANLYPNGVFVSSVNLFFATKDSTIPVNVRIRPTVNGFPDAVNDIPGSLVYKNPADINIPAPSVVTNDLGPATTFTFDYPIFLLPGQYSLMIASDSNQYTMYASKLGQVQYGTQNVITQLNYLGSLFKSQNASTWVPAPGETLAFIMNVCDFAGGSVTFDVKSKMTDEIDFDLIHLMTQDLAFNSLDSINYKVLTHNLATGTQSSPVPVVANQNYNFTSRQKVSTAGDIIIRPTITNTDRWTSPVIDLERLNTILIRNNIAPYYSANTTSESLGGHYNGGAVARYITRRVTLNNNFDSTGLTVFLDVNRQPGTKIEVYYKVLSILDLNTFDDQPYHLMDPILAPGAGLAYTGPSDWTSDTYQALNITYNDITNNTLYSSFNIFAIKVVMYSSNPAIVPQIKNFRAIATA
jgi:hypothetical protein